MSAMHVLAWAITVVFAFGVVAFSCAAAFAIYKRIWAAALAAVFGASLTSLVVVTSPVLGLLRWP